MVRSILLRSAACTARGCSARTAGKIHRYGRCMCLTPSGADYGSIGGQRPESRCPGPAASLAADLEVVEVGPGVGLGPQADLARLREGRVLRFEILLAVQGDGHLVALHGDLESMPLAGGYLQLFLRFQLDPFAIDDLVEAQVVLQGVHAGDVVVVG